MRGKPPLGQHFLVREDTADRIVAAAGLRPGEAVVEIGPGRGILTRRLLSAGARVTAVELDRKLFERLRDIAGDLTLKNADFLTLDLSELPRPAKFVANLPYAVASPILQRILSWDGWSLAVLMFQKEVAERILAGPGSRKYGLLSVSVALKAQAGLVCEVSRESFSPRPAVQGGVVKLLRSPRPLLPEEISEEDFFATAKAAFSHRRKRLANSLARGLNLSKPHAEGALLRARIPLSARAEDVSLEGYLALARELRSQPLRA